MKLIDLEPQFVQYINGKNMQYVDTIESADGIRLLCPKCFNDNSGPIGTHYILCWFVGKVPSNAEPGPGRWRVTGTGYDNLTLSPSILLPGVGCKWHGFIKDGNIVWHQ